MIVIDMRQNAHEWEKKNLVTFGLRREEVMTYIDANIVV